MRSVLPLPMRRRLHESFWRMRPWRLPASARATVCGPKLAFAFMGQILLRIPRLSKPRSSGQCQRSVAAAALAAEDFPALKWYCSNSIRSGQAARRSAAADANPHSGRCLAVCRGGRQRSHWHSHIGRLRAFTRRARRHGLRAARICDARCGLFAEVRGTRIPVEVTDLPFVPHRYKRA